MLLCFRTYETSLLVEESISDELPYSGKRPSDTQPWGSLPWDQDLPSSLKCCLHGSFDTMFCIEASKFLA